MEEVMSQNTLTKNSNGIISDLVTEKDTTPSERGTEDELVGQKLCEIRTQRELTLKSLAELSKLNINTLSMIEKGKTSPSIGTLQRLARALEVPITTFFESNEKSKRIIFTAHDSRPESTCCEALIQNLGMGLNSSAMEPFIVTMQKNAGSGGRTIIHSGFEFAYCMSGKVLYRIEEIEYPLAVGDSIVFAAQLPHRWENMYNGESQIILVFTPGEQLQSQGKSHFHMES
jgi:transcriptional regulator with XRE-family HTH domain